jgi:hypothetical protein
MSRKKPTMGKKFWQYMYIKSRKKDTINIAALINSSGEEVIDSKGKVDILNQQYDSVFTDENMLEIPELGDNSISDIGKLTVTENGVNKLLKNLNITKAIGPDLIPSRVLKEAAGQIKPFLTRIFNQTLESGEAPADWRQANITAIYKKGLHTQAVNYRPVSLMSVCCKIMEHIIFHHIMSHLDEHNILVDHQHGFRQHRSCETQLR